MKRVLLMGDSIRIGYHQYAKELLKDQCEVIYSEDNSRFVQYHYWQLNQMFKHEGPFDIVHFNSGYWDMNIEPPMKEALNSIKEYLQGLKKIVKLIRAQGATPIFSNTVPIYKDGDSSDNTGVEAEITYKNDWVITYNEAALELMNQLQVEVVDMYSEMLKGPLYYKCPDMLHLTEEGSEVAANLVVSKIKEYL